MDLLPSPVTLVVKAPNQKVADQMVECALDWTIKKLKTHLSNVYPNKPEEHQQRIIYSGRLLQDDLQLKDILREFEPNQTVHTVHLVCSNPEIYSTKSTTLTDGMSSAAGVRHRKVQQQTTTESSSSQSQTFTSPAAESTEHPAGTSSQGFHPWSGYNPASTMGYPTSMGMPQTAVTSVGVPPQPAMIPGFPYSPEQMMWLQQMYAQQMAQYMQYYQNAPHASPQDSTDPQAPTNQNAPLAQPANQQAAQERNQPMVMNAAGNAMVDDDENVNRDWLDWLYTCSRFVVLLSIVYFYSTLSRFVVVLSSFIVLYLYQQGWFRIQRNVVNRRDEQRRDEQEDIQNEENARREENVENEAEENPAETSTESETNPAEEAAEPHPGYHRVLLTFFTTFFTSLVPQPPPPVNIN